MYTHLASVVDSNQAGALDMAHFSLKYKLNIIHRQGQKKITSSMFSLLNSLQKRIQEPEA
jgi:hypothetical protein